MTFKEWLDKPIGIRIRDSFLIGVPLLFVSSVAIGLLDGEVDSLWQQYELAIAERLICVMLMLSLLHWYDRMKGITHDNDSRNNMYYGFRILAVSIIMAFGGF